MSSRASGTSRGRSGEEGVPLASLVESRRSDFHSLAEFLGDCSQASSRTESLFDKSRSGVRPNQPHNFWFLIVGLFNELKYAVRTKNYINVHYAKK